MKRIQSLLAAAALSWLFSAPAFAGTGTITVLDAGGVTRTYAIVTNGATNFVGQQTICDGSAAAQCVAVKAASTAAVATDPAVVVAVSPNNAVVLGAGSAAIGSITNTSFAATQATAANLNATVVGTGTFPVQATLQASATTAIGKVDPNTIGNWGLQVSTQNSATPTNGGLVLGQFNTSPSTITTGNVSPLQLDNAGNLLVNIKAGSSSGAVAQGSTTSGQTGGLIQAAATTSAPSYSTATTNPLSLDTSGSLRVNCTTGCGGGTGGTAIADEAAFTFGTTQFTPIGGVFNSVITNLTSGQAGAVQLTNTRRLVDQNPDIGTVGTAAGCSSGSSNTLVQCFYQFHTDLTASIPAGTNAIGNVGSATGSAVPSIAVYNGGLAINAEPTAASNGNLVGMSVGLEGKLINLPYANKENMLRGANSATGTGATTLIAAQGASVKTYITSVQCYRSDAGTTASTVLFSDAAATEIVLPNGGGGGGSNVTFPVPLVTAANTAFTFTSGASLTTVFCNAQGYKGA